MMQCFHSPTFVGVFVFWGDNKKNGVSRPGFLPSAGESWGQEAAAGAACVADIILRLSLF